MSNLAESGWLSQFGDGDATNIELFHLTFDLLLTLVRYAWIDSLVRHVGAPARKCLGERDAPTNAIVEGEAAAGERQRAGTSSDRSTYG